jgi:hypothetical protein
MSDAALKAHIHALGEVPQQPDTYRGWSVYRGRWPEPAFMALGPNYDASYEGEEIGWTDNGEKADGKTWEAVCAEIDTWHEENAPAQPPSDAL